MLLMLCQVSRVRQRYWNLQNHPKGQCLLPDLLFRYCSSGVGADALSLRLGAVKESTRAPVVRSLVCHVRELVEDAEGDGIHGVASTIACLTHAIKRLARNPQRLLSFEGEDFLFELAANLRYFSDKAHSLGELPDIPGTGSSLWTSVGSSTADLASIAIESPNPSSSVPKLFNGGTLVAIARCAYQPSCSPEAATRALELMLPYVYTPAASFGTQDSMLALDNGWDETPPLSGKPLSVWSSYPTAYSHNYDAFDEPTGR
ncbi:hypothetical protein FA13DRAFT_938418 [Coprinellus micaceus]|uniref:Uncharacterized protein n=1 Tax=Coprinellus micaceus TaxID=71717 RepID=A0A4Y7T023_COPMI|nr:hypothetical protein FA13DRAFT_938418 [Coprinellus micaceus]